MRVCSTVFADIPGFRCQAHLRYSAWNNLDMGQFELARCALRLLPPAVAQRLLRSVVREPLHAHRWLHSASVPSLASLSGARPG